MHLSYEQKKHFAEKGYVKIPSVIPQPMVHETVKMINSSLGTNGMNKEDLPQFRARSYCPELQNMPLMRDLIIKTPTLDFAESIIGKDKIKPVHMGQIALRFPSMQEKANKPGYHLDGIYSENNGVKEKTYHNFTMLLGIMMSDLPHENSGNLTVWPGSHLLYEEYFRKHGTDILMEKMPPIDIGDPVQITGKAGDIVLCHYQLAHGIASNMSPHIRYALYYRLKHEEHDSVWKETYKNIWMHYPGIREL